MCVTDAFSRFLWLRDWRLTKMRHHSLLSFLLQTDGYNHLIRRVVLSTGLVATLAGTAGVTGTQNGVGTSARFNYPKGIAVQGGDTLVVGARCGDVGRRR